MDLPESFDTLVEQAAPQLLAYAYRRCRQPADADDAVAETLLIAWRRRADLPRGSQQIPWLFGICWRVIRGQQRSSARYARLVARLRGVHRIVAGPTVSRSDQVLQALDALGSADRELLRLVAWEGLTPSQLAVVLAITPNTAAVRLHRARSRYREELRRLRGNARDGER